MGLEMNFLRVRTERDEAREALAKALNDLDTYKRLAEHWESEANNLAKWLREANLLLGALNESS